MLACFTDWILLFFFMFNLQLLFVLQSVAFLLSNCLLLLLLFWKDGGFDNACKAGGASAVVRRNPKGRPFGKWTITYSSTHVICKRSASRFVIKFVLWHELTSMNEADHTQLRFFFPPSCTSPWAKKLQVLLLHPHVRIPAHMFSVCLSVMQDSNSMCWLLLFFPSCRKLNFHWGNL